jgi:hypothetical protein
VFSKNRNIRTLAHGQRRTPFHSFLFLAFQLSLIRLSAAAAFQPAKPKRELPNLIRENRHAVSVREFYSYAHSIQGAR